MAHILKSATVSIDRVVEELSTSPFHIKELAKSTSLKNFLHFLSHHMPHEMAPVLEDATRICAERKKKLLEENISKKRDASTSGEPENNKRIKVKESNRATNLTEHRKFFTLQTKAGTSKSTTPRTTPITSDEGSSRSTSRTSEQLDEHDCKPELAIEGAWPRKNTDTEAQVIPDSDEGTSELGNEIKPGEEDQGAVEEAAPGTCTPLLGGGSEQGGGKFAAEETDKDEAMLTPDDESYEDEESPMQHSNSSRGTDPPLEREKRYQIEVASAEKPLGTARTTPGVVSYLEQNEEADSAASELHGSTVITGAPGPNLDRLWETELGLTGNVADIIKPMKEHCKTFRQFDGRRRINEREEINEIFTECNRHLFFETVKRDLLTYLRDRKVVPGSRIEIPSTWEMTDPSEIFSAIKTITSKSKDAKIHRAYAQMKLRFSIDEKIEKGFKPVFHGKMSEAANYLEELGIKAAGKVSHGEIKKSVNDHVLTYNAGKRWLEVADWFGGPGVAIVFVIAEIGSSKVAKGWRIFQRHCLHYVSEHLPSIKGLVKVLGPEALEQYCRDGYLTQEYIDKVEKYKGLIPGEAFEYGSPEREVRPLRLEDLIPIREFRGVAFKSDKSYGCNKAERRD